MLDVALARDFAKSREIYLSYAAAADGGAQTRVARARLSADGARLVDVAVIFRQEPAQSGGRHFGSASSPRRTVRSSSPSATGANGRSPEPHRPSGFGCSHPPRRRAPSRQSFIGAGRGWREEIFSYGHRNPQGAAMAADGVLWTVEHGARGGDEINTPEVGVNYGWPTISYGRHYSGGEIGVRTKRRRHGAAEILLGPVDRAVGARGL